LREDTGCRRRKKEERRIGLNFSLRMHRKSYKWRLMYKDFVEAGFGKVLMSATLSLTLRG